MKTDQPIIEWAPFKLAAHADEATLLNTAELIEKEFLQKQPGYLRRELLKKDAQHWVDLVYWESEESAKQAVNNANCSDACHAYFSLMEGVESAEGGIQHLTQMKTWTQQ